MDSRSKSYKKIVEKIRDIVEHCYEFDDLVADDALVKIYDVLREHDISLGNGPGSHKEV